MSDTEHIVCENIARGYAVKQIADMMCRSPYTIDTHIKNVKRKNGLKNIADITREFILSLDNPKQFFRTMVAAFFLSIQGFTIVFSDVDEYRLLRSGKRTVRVVKARVSGGRKTKQ
ncbi:hypothetical protein ICJ85_01115 [Aestuariibaculum marinum]|uniref:HTH luxR-type domain-containing protein n=1 Tax=Aestuariibaculum marinum TaxID=2683592 RepID=A0A8J6PQH4_9FLAO|nr:hypothetical protein [Aestuariibaculum marinum]